jgi:peroxisomal 2,4-dienoyl-CoA reductase
MTIFAKDALAGRRALVTGGGSGICKGIALALADHGADVAVVGRRQEPLYATVSELRARGRKGLALPADVREHENVDNLVERAVQEFGGLDIVINGAAGNFLAPAAALSPGGFGAVVDIDLKGTFHVSRAAFEALSESEHACILNISATLHYGGTPMQLHVSAAKAGVDALTRNLAVEWGQVGVRVNGIAPGPIDDTEGMARLAPGDVKKKIEGKVPLRRFGKISEIADAAVFLASDAARYITGHTLVVDGGAWLVGSGFDVDLLG